MSPKEDSVATEGNRFSVQPMATDLTIECARKYLASLRKKGGDSVEADIESGRATKDFSDEEVAEMLKRFSA